MRGIYSTVTNLFGATPPAQRKDSCRQKTEPVKAKKKRYKNAPDFNAAALSRDYFGVDLLKK